MVRMNEDGDPMEISDLSDDAYFRLNIWGMGRTRQLALWGAGLASSEEMLASERKWQEQYNYEGQNLDFHEAMVRIDEEVVQMGRLNEYHADTDDGSWLEPFCSNWNVATAEQCLAFANGLRIAQRRIDEAVVKFDVDYEYYWEFAEWLEASPHGVFVG